MTSTGSGSSKSWRILGSTGGNTHRFRIYDNTNSREPFYIDNDGVSHFGGDVKVLSGDIQMGNNRGINFSPHANAGGMTSETLDDYEEGTWSPLWSNATTGGTTSSGSNNHGRYIKIGKQVTAIFYTWGLPTVGNSDAMILQGFPFSTAEMSEYWGAVQAGFFNMGDDSYYNLGVALHGSAVNYGYLQFSRKSSGDATPATFNGFINYYTNFTGSITYITS